MVTPPVEGIAEGQHLAETIECPICKAPIGVPCMIFSRSGTHVGRHGIRESDARRAASSPAVTP